MRLALLALLPSLVAGSVSAEPAKAPPRRALALPHSIGKFGEWQAATHPEGGDTVCYAFTRAEASAQKITGRGDVVLTVTRRQNGRDVAAISAGFVLSGHGDAVLQAGPTRLLFYIAGRSAFARDNAAAIAAFGHEQSVAARLPGPRGVVAADRFSLKGFASAFQAMQKLCPAQSDAAALPMPAAAPPAPPAL